MNRRDFFNPRQLVRPAGELLGAVEEIRSDLAQLAKEAADDAVLLRFARRAMATTFEVILPFGTPQTQESAEAALDHIDQLEAQLSVYRDDSEVSRLNRTAADQPVRVEGRLFALLTLAHQLWHETGGAFDISVGALIKAWGFFRRAGRVPNKEELQSVRQKMGMRYVHLDAKEQTVAFRRQGLEINLGSIGKGYALDRVVEDLRERWGCASALVHGGHSSIFALGSEPGGKHGWSIGLLDPDIPSRRIAELRLCDRGMATSAATFQNLEYQGRKLPHLLDPRTGWPAESMRMATVTAPSAAQADALSTAFFILGVEAARAYCTAHPEIGAILLPHEKRDLIVIGAVDARTST
ncbi:MAG: FAD:protein FMN transferase [Gemmataceae bacterium]|nr:FAD:protein FMN transferase [Gemmataceae bacterium]